MLDLSIHPLAWADAFAVCVIPEALPRSGWIANMQLLGHGPSPGELRSLAPERLRAHRDACHATRAEAMRDPPCARPLWSPVTEQAARSDWWPVGARFLQ